MGRLDYAEKMLQACALLDLKDGANNSTAGVPNCYLAACANLNLACANHCNGPISGHWIFKLFTLKSTLRSSNLILVFNSLIDLDGIV
jgi:hypothetical protein